MSSHQHVHFGAYLEVDIKPISREYFTYECKNHPEIRHMNESLKFCSICGKKLMKMRHESEEYVNYYDLIDDDPGDRLKEIDGISSFNKTILISNIRGDGTCISIDNGDDGIYEIQDHNFYISKMYREYGDLSKKLVDHEAVNALTFKCGMIVYWN